MKLNLTAQSREQEILLAYLQENASEVLAEKINRGVPVEKNGVPLMMKKDLSGFLKYATEEAKKVAAKGATAACIEDTTVFGWMMHYFEEDTIEDSYFHPDGTPYTPTKKKTKKPAPAKPRETPRGKPQQEDEFTIFDMLANLPMEESPAEETLAYHSESGPTEDEIQAAIAAYDEMEMPEIDPEEPAQPTPPVSYEQWEAVQRQYPKAIILMVAGSRVEAYGAHALILSRDLGLKLDSRDFGAASPLPAVSFAYSLFETYFPMIYAEYDVVLVVSSDTDPIYYRREQPNAPIRQWQRNRLCRRIRRCP